MHKACRKRAGAGKSNKLCKRAKRRCVLSKRGQKASRKFRIDEEERADWLAVHKLNERRMPGPRAHHIRFSLDAYGKKKQAALAERRPHIHQHWAHWH